MTYKLKSASITDITRLPFPKEPCNYVYIKDSIVSKFYHRNVLTPNTLNTNTLFYDGENLRHAFSKQILY